MMYLTPPKRVKAWGDAPWDQWYLQWWGTPDQNRKDHNTASQSETQATGYLPNPSEEAKAWGKGPLRPEGSSVPSHIWAELCISQNGPPKWAPKQLEWRTNHVDWNHLTLSLTCIYGGGRVHYVGSTAFWQPDLRRLLS